MEWTEARNQLKAWREDNSRHSAEVVELWKHYMESYKNKLADEKWMVLEQVFIAALDCNQMDVADDCYIELGKQFPGSRRILKLKAMRLEALERYDDALVIYDAIIREDETNSTARKRKIAIFKAQARYIEAIKELIEYLKKFMSDGEAWHELSDLYLKQGDYSKACFCLEEVMLTSPFNHLLCTRYAEIKYTQGGQDNVDTARSYFCQAVKFNPNYTKAWYGLLMTCSNIGTKAVSAKRKELNKLFQYAQKKIQERYTNAKVDDKKIELLCEALSSLGAAEKN